MAKKGEWVRLHIVALRPEERAPQVPDDTKAVPLEMWVKGNLTNDCELGNEAEVLTRTGRRVKGKLVEIEPGFHHSFGYYMPELQRIDETVKGIVFGGAHD